MESCRQSVCDETLSQVKVYLAEGSYPLGVLRSKDFQVDGDTSTMYYIKQESKRIVLFGDTDRRRAFTECHASSSGGHQGRDRTEGRMKQYYWPSMHLDIRKWISECESCQRMNPSVKCPTLDLQPVPVTGLWEMWGVDIIGPLTLTPRGNRYIIVATDYFSKWPEAAALPNKNAISVATFLYSLYCRFGAGDIVTDQGREFVNKIFDGKEVKCMNSFVFNMVATNSYTVKKSVFKACTIRQTNAVDCGVLVCKFADCIVKKLPLTFSVSIELINELLLIRICLDIKHLASVMAGNEIDPSQVEAVKHFLYGIAIDEGADGLRAISLAWVLKSKGSVGNCFFIIAEMVNNRYQSVASKTNVVDRACAHIEYGEEVTNDVDGSGTNTEEVERVAMGNLSNTEQADEVEDLSDNEQVDEMEDISDPEQVDGVEDFSDPEQVDGVEDLSDPEQVDGVEDLSDPEQVDGVEDLSDPKQDGEDLSDPEQWKIFLQLMTQTCHLKLVNLK
ncbi:hypothetical protein EMCRGX_G010456 [Ephydatia muelleri]